MSRVTPLLIPLCASVCGCVCRVRVAVGMGLTLKQRGCRGTLRTQFEGVSCVLDPAVDIDAVGVLLPPPHVLQPPGHTPTTVTASTVHVG